MQARKECQDRFAAERVLFSPLLKSVGRRKYLGEQEIEECPEFGEGILKRRPGKENTALGVVPVQCRGTRYPRLWPQGHGAGEGAARELGTATLLGDYWDSLHESRRELGG